MNIVCCNEVDYEVMYNVFKEGFSDYIVSFEMDQQQFQKHFFGPEANKRIFSYVAYDREIPVGLILGGCQQYDGIMTLRCGAMCVIPNYREHGVGTALMNAHEQLARDLGCKQLFLECIQTNEKALAFYLTLGYEVVHQLRYYTKSKHKGEMLVEVGDWLDYQKYRSEVESHVNWQNEVWYVEHLNPEIKMIKKDGDIVALLLHAGSKIAYIHVKKEYRLNGFAESLISSINETMLTVGFPSQGGLDGFFRHIGFSKSELSQVEMYKYL